MKKKCNVLPVWQNSRLLLRMKLLSLFFFLFVIQTNASVYSQNTKLSLKINNARIEEVIKLFEQQSDFLFIYRSDLFEGEDRINVNVEKGRIEEFLDEYIVPLGYGYEVINQTVVIRKAEMVNPSKNLKDAEQDKKVTGNVRDVSGAPLPGVTITVLGLTKGVITDGDGNFEIYGLNPSNKLVFSFIGMESQIVDVGNETKFDIVLKEKSTELDDVTVVAFGKQKKESVISSIETVNVQDLKIPSSNLTTAMAGNMAGIISYQRSGEPGEDNAEFFVRGVTTFGYSKSPLILIDGIELSANDLARLQPDDIASFSIMKDATATALYGARGANGVILVTTKEGREGKPVVNIRFENSISQPTKEIEFADNITFMQKHTEAVLMRDINALPKYSEDKIFRTANGGDPLRYPNNDWRSTLTKRSTMNQRLNFNVSGGGKVARYYLAASATKDNGILQNAERNSFDNNIDLRKYLLRSNINLNITKTTEAAIKFHATFDDYTGPVVGGAELYKMTLYANPVLFPAYYEPDEKNKFTNHILYGNYGEGNYLNPYAELTKGYRESDRSLILSQFEITQNLDIITKGLSAKFIYNTNREARSGISRFYNPYYYQLPNATGAYNLAIINPEGGTEYLGYTEDQKVVFINNYFESRLNYNRTFNEKHGLSGLLVFVTRESKFSNPGTLQKSLPYRNLGLSGRFTYDYDTRYFIEFNFGYNGSERFAKNERFGFFPSIGIGYIVSNEKFFEPLKNSVNKLKLKATYGLVGNDAIGSAEDRFFFLSEVNLNDNNVGGVFGTKYDYFRSGVSVARYENDQIKWEIAKKYNLGLEIGMFNALNINVDFFGEYRSNILMDRIILASMGLQSGVRANVGEAKNQGIDMSLDYSHRFNNGAWLIGRGNFTYAHSEMVKYEEPDYSSTHWLSRVGHPINQTWGYIAERLFVDQDEINNSPVQFGEYLPGDIKYKDVNSDGKISTLDKVPIGFPTVPEIIYGFGISTGYKNFDFSCFFQGSARSSFWIDQEASAPFRENGYSNSKLGNTNFLKAYADNHWSNENQNLFATWPRLSEQLVENNNQVSTWFMRNGSFLRLKSVEFGYTIPVKSLDKLRIYASGTNLLTFSGFKIWDPEMGGNGFGYPVQKVFNLGLQINF